MHPSSNGSKTFGVVEKDNGDSTVDVKVHLTPSVFKVVLQKSISTKICQLILVRTASNSSMLFIPLSPAIQPRDLRRYHQVTSSSYDPLNTLPSIHPCRGIGAGFRRRMRCKHCTQIIGDVGGDRGSEKAWVVKKPVAISTPTSITFNRFLMLILREH